MYFKSLFLKNGDVTNRDLSHTALWKSFLPFYTVNTAFKGTEIHVYPIGVKLLKGNSMGAQVMCYIHIESYLAHILQLQFHVIYNCVMIQMYNCTVLPHFLDNWPHPLHIPAAHRHVQTHVYSLQVLLQLIELTRKEDVQVSKGLNLVQSFNAE